MKFLKLLSRLVILSILLTIFNTACRYKRIVLKSPPHYNFSEVFTDKLDLQLQEISGIAWDSKNNYFLAISDESDKLFFLDKETKIIRYEYSIGKKADYEEVATLNGIPYILRSDGMITRFNKDSSGKTSGIEVGKINLSGKNDFETMYSDPAHKALVVICKNCGTDDAKSISAFAFYPDSAGFDNKPLFVIDAAKVASLSPYKTSKFQPSAAAIHPVLHKLFIISSASGQLVIADLKGKVESVFKLSKKLFPQPEGITFKQNGDMYISNEGLGVKSNLLKFLYENTPDSANIKSSNAGYNFSMPDDKMELGKHLHEISGITYVPGKDMILGENDEKGDIFSIDFKNKVDKAGKIKFGGKGDYEDIVYTDSAVYMLVSNGTIVKIDTRDITFNTKEFTLGGEKNEFESLYLDADNKSLIMLCKECAHEKKTGVRVAYRFDLATNMFSPEVAYTINIEDIKRLLNDDQALFKPSGAGINPVNGKLYIVSSVGKLLLVADKNGKPEEVYRLDPNLFNQPEGLTFAPNGDLYISNEGGEGNATIYQFAYK